jgi:hypothetical protein
MLTKEKHVREHWQLIDEISRDRHKLEWFIVADPGTSTCFAVLFGAINPYTKKVYLLDEIYEKDQRMTSVRMMYPRMEMTMKRLFPGSSIHDQWVKVFDEAAAWFSNETMQQYGVYFMPTEKHIHKKEVGISLIKDIMIHDFLAISDNCPNLFKEMQEYAKDDNGEIPKKRGVHDHLIDCFRYLLGANNYSMLEALEGKVYRDPEEDMRRELRKGLALPDKDDGDYWDDDWMDW